MLVQAENPSPDVLIKVVIETSRTTSAARLSSTARSRCKSRSPQESRATVAVINNNTIKEKQQNPLFATMASKNRPSVSKVHTRAKWTTRSLLSPAGGAKSCEEQMAETVTCAVVRVHKASFLLEEATSTRRRDEEMEGSRRQLRAWSEFDCLSESTWGEDGSMALDWPG
jgi:hypothetical protein